MNIALVVHDFDPRYGQGRYAVELARRLAAAHDVYVYANRFALPPEPGVSYQKIPAWRRSAFATVFTFLVGAERALSRRRHDLVHAQGLTCWNADVITAHICNAARYPQATGNWRAKGFPLLVTPVERRFFQNPRARHLIAASKVVAEEIRQHYGWERSASVIYHGTDVRQFRPPNNEAERQKARARYGLGGGKWTWLFAGEAVKGLRQVVEQLPAFPEAELLVVTRSAAGPMLELAARLGVADRVHWQGPEDAMAFAYQAADVLVYPSAYDAFGLVVAEAMASGLPVVVGSRIGAAEWIEPGINGLTCEPSAPASLHAALSRLRADPEQARLLGRAARRTVERHGWDVCAAATEQVYARVLGERRRA